MKCHFCGMEIGDKDSLITHLKINHKDELRNLIIEQLRFLEKKSHKKIFGEIMRCPLCGPGALFFGKRYTAEELADHILEKHEKWIKKGLKMVL